jgi:uncharacterized protein (DUF1499 family)
MSFKDWFTKNIYVTKPNDSDPFFHPRRYEKTKEEIIQAVQGLLKELAPRWRVEEYRENQGRIHATHAGLLPFAEDVNIYVVQGLDGITTLDMTSQSRGGKGDWGQNKRNIREFLTALDSKVQPKTPE